MEDAEAGVPAEQTPEQKEQVDVAAIASQVGDGLSKLAEVLQGAGASEEDQAEMATVLQGFTNLVEKHLGAGEPEAQAIPQEISAMGGPEGVPMGPQGRM